MQQSCLKNSNNKTVCSLQYDKYSSCITPTYIAIISLVTMVFTLLPLIFLTTWHVGLTLFLVILIPISFNQLYLVGLCVRYLFFIPHYYQKKACEPNDKIKGVVAVLPTRNEPFDVAKMTFGDLWKQKWEGIIEIIVVDNSDENHEDYQRWKEYVESYPSGGNNKRATFLHRDPAIPGYKPYNIDIALDYAKKQCEWAEIFLFIDVDSTLQTTAVQCAAQAFNDDKDLGFCQFLTVSTNYTFNLQTSSLAIRQSVERFILGMRSFGGFCLFYGHNGFFRKDVLDAIGIWTEDFNNAPILTEDISATVKAYIAGYKGKTIFQKAGEWVPASLDDLYGQWERWAYGAFQVIGKHGKNIIKSRNAMTRCQFFDMLQVFLFFVSRALIPLIVAWGLINKSIYGTIVLFGSIVVSIAFNLKYVVNNHSQYKNRKFNIIGSMLISTFVLSSLIDWIIFIASLKFILGMRQGWHPTGKGQIVLKGFVKQKILRRLIPITLSAIGIWYLLEGISNATDLILILPQTIFCFSLLLAHILFWATTRKKNDSIVGTRIDDLINA